MKLRENKKNPIHNTNKIKLLYQEISHNWRCLTIGHLPSVHETVNMVHASIPVYQCRFLTILPLEEVNSIKFFEYAIKLKYLTSTYKAILGFPDSHLY